ncbi:chemotaxis response regulator protein-glutamate methylesterase [Armatimonas sp.]|uniref:protein-glutamate methylesterase/protein-glutamine glutaminase n=1 Tax=Armatimonas sp. TaxID=1872638 RepID=UPI00286A2B1D|nr:chemotaxis response regulator protein-glutamate methylesterase [Armatimonas sp.]
MAKIRVLLADDAVVVRRILTDTLAEDPDIEVVGTAPNGKIALAKLAQLTPDIVILDVEMPDMDGLEALKEIRKTNRLIPVIMFSTLTQRGAVATLDALSFGASDYVTKPSNVGSVGAAMQTIRETLIPKIKLFTRHNSLRDTTIRPAPRLVSSESVAVAPLTLKRPMLASATSATTMRGSERVEVLAIGTSTGGPDALNIVLPQLPADFPVPIVIVQHMPPMFTKLLAERLNSRCAISVAEATQGMLLEPGKAWVAPGDFHLALERTDGKLYTRVFVGPPENSCRPAVDVMLRSVAQFYGAGCLSVILTGMGQDGLRGCEAVSSMGGQVIAQDEASSVVWGMPGFVAQAGLASKVLPLSEIAGEIIRRTMAGRPARRVPLPNPYLGVAA